MPQSLLPFLQYKYAHNWHNAYALGTQMRNGFHVRRVVWGRLMAKMDKRDGEEIRKVRLMVETRKKARQRKARKHANAPAAAASHAGDGGDTSTRTGKTVIA